MLSIYVDDLDSIKQQLPTTLDFGTVNVEILTVSVTNDWLVVGASCGVIFIFTRFDAKLYKQIRTSSTDTISCLSVLGNQIAVGHHSGLLFLIHLQTGKSKKVDKYTDRDQHRGSALRQVIWSTKDCTKLVSSDESGIAILTNVDFHKKAYTHSFLFCDTIPSAIRSIDLSEHQALICGESNQCSLVVLESAEVTLVGEQTCNSSQVIGVAWLNEETFCLLHEDFRVFLYKKENLATPMRIFDLLEEMKRHFIAEISINGQVMSAGFEKPSTLRWLTYSESHCCLSTNLNQLLLLRMNTEITVEMAFYLGDLKIKDASYFDKELFLLHQNRDLLRISTRKVTTFQEMQMDGMQMNDSIGPSLSSIVDSTSTLLGKMRPSKDATVKETIEDVASRGMDAISTRITPSLNQLLDNMRKHVDNSNFGAEEGEIPAGSMVCKGKMDEIEVAEDVSQENAVSVHSPQSNDEEVRLRNVRMVVAQLGTGRRHSPDRSSHLFSSSPKSFQPSPLAQRRKDLISPASSSTTEDEKSRLGAESEEDEELDEEKALKLILERTAVPSGSTDSQTTVSLEIPADDSPKKLALQKEKLEKAVVVNDLVDIWNEIQLPFTPSSLSANKTHLLMCHRKKHPKWAPIEDLNTKKRLEWINANFMADQLESNEDGSLIWRIKKGVPKMCTALSPTVSWIPVESCSNGVSGCALAAKDAWYGTDNRVIAI
ncbi:unnamed protein product, partial [Mesorhabditis belari]|uniref:Uncharacterized protein n=1 Tax=Mesorhabditis belari TaxID=2138241 RepID=A0AAF3FD84_9BILA